MNEGKWITLKDGRHILLKPKNITMNDTNFYMNDQIRGQFPKSETRILEEKSKKRWEELKEKYKDLSFENEDLEIDEISLKPHTFADREYEEANIDFDLSYNGHYNDTTQKELNLMPIRIDTYIDRENEWGYRETMVYSSIFRNRKDMEKSFKQYGGLKQFTGGSRYQIKSQSGIGEYYLERDDFYKTGWVWKDVNFDNVKGAEWMDHTKRENRLKKLMEEDKKHDEEMREKYPEWYK